MAKGQVKAIEPAGGDFRLVVDSGALDLGNCAAGDSIAVSGVCLTMLAPQSNSFQADVSTETLDHTSLGSLKPGQPVNLELALTLQHRLGGHLVSGHVDGVAKLVSRAPDGRAERFEFKVPHKLARYIAQKGSVCVDGVSLTVNDVDGNRFGVCLIPHTLDVTTLAELKPGEIVNIEVDLIARYVERLAQAE